MKLRHVSINMHWLALCLKGDIRDRWDRCFKVEELIKEGCTEQSLCSAHIWNVSYSQVHNMCFNYQSTSALVPPTILWDSWSVLLMAKHTQSFLACLFLMPFLDQRPVCSVSVLLFVFDFALHLNHVSFFTHIQRTVFLSRVRTTLESVCSRSILTVLHSEPKLTFT